MPLVLCGVWVFILIKWFQKTVLWEDFVRKSQCSIEVPEHEGSRAVHVTQKDRCVSATGPCHSFQRRERPLPGGHFWTAGSSAVGFIPAGEEMETPRLSWHSGLQGQEE